ncbi:MAG: helix-turn-helix domain-containing protein [Pseudonocardia sp.]
MAADNTEQQCARCQRDSRDKFVTPPEVPAECWQGEPLREAFAVQHIGRVIRAYRMSPHHHAVHGPKGITQGLLGQWISLSQTQISKIETGPQILNLDTLRHWARVLLIPQEWLWFDLSGQGDKSFRNLDDTDDDVPAPGSDAGPTTSAHVSFGASFLGGNLTRCCDWRVRMMKRC